MQTTQNKAFIITGFGEFFKVKDNPTSHLLNSISEEEKSLYNIIDASVLEVSIEGVDNHISQMQKIIKDN